MATIEFKQRILDAIKQQRSKYPSDSKMAIALGTSPAQFSRIIKGEFDSVISDAALITIARKLEVPIGISTPWVTAKTPVYSYITSQLELCQQNSMGGMLCDKTDLGKTYSARCYVREHKNAVYIDCSQSKTRRMLLIQIAKEFGLTASGVVREIYQDLVYYLRSLERPLIILDEAGDLNYEATLELKALWNATEGYCGWYMMGADGLRKKFEANRTRQKVGYPELFSRYGSRYQRITPEGKEASREFAVMQAVLIAKANNASEELLSLIPKSTEISLRRIQIEVNKQRRA